MCVRNSDYSFQSYDYYQDNLDVTWTVGKRLDVKSANEMILNKQSSIFHYISVEDLANISEWMYKKKLKQLQCQ
jgi:hypothetical protein